MLIRVTLKLVIEEFWGCKREPLHQVKLNQGHSLSPWTTLEVELTHMVWRMGGRAEKGASIVCDHGEVRQIS